MTSEMYDPDEEVTMLSEHKDLLTENLAALSEGMNTEVVLRQLKKNGFIDDYGIEQVMDFKTKVEKNTDLLDQLKRSGPEAFNRFFSILMNVDPPLADKLLPVQYHILWFAPSPSLAAMVEHTLCNVSFSNIEGRRSQKKFLQKRGRVFAKNFDFKSIQTVDEGQRVEYVKYSQNCEITLTFPITDKADVVDLAIEQVLNEYSSYDMFVMSGVCKGVKSGGDYVRSGEVIIAMEAHGHHGIDHKVSPKNEFIDATKRELKIHNPPWAGKARSKLTPPIGEHPHLVPHFGRVCSNPLSTESSQTPVGGTQFLASDSHTFQFYKQCLQCVGVDKPWFSCLGVCSYTSINNEDVYHDNSSCSMASTGVALETCRVWYERSEKK